jgi:thiol-disulfide isomerase/thioredoxin
MPDLSPEEVDRFVALGKAGWGRFRAGDAAGAEAAFRGQIAIFPVNPEPYVSLALVAAHEGAQKQALEHLRAAVVRGFTDLARVERAEAWTRMRRHIGFLRLQDAVPALLEVERKWGDWNSYEAFRPPEDVAAAEREHRGWTARIDRMAPALGPRLVRLWKKAIDRATAALLEIYVARRPEAPDLAGALDRLMALYSGTPLMRWDLLPADAAGRLSKVAGVALARFPEGRMRPGALVCRALARYAERDGQGDLGAAAAEEIRSCLGEVLAEHPDSAFVAIAAEGLVRTEAELGRMDLAAERYREFRGRQGGNRELVDRVRDGLGELALRAGGLPEFRAIALDGAPVGLEELRGKVVVVDFWATWCQPCLEELPTLRRIGERHGAEVLLLGVNLDRADDLPREALREWVAREAVPGRQLHDGLSWDSELVKLFGVKEIPFSVVASPEGAVLAVNEHGRRLEQAVVAALRGR